MMDDSHQHHHNLLPTIAVLGALFSSIVITAAYAQSSTSNPPPTITATCKVDNENWAGIPRLYADVEASGFAWGNDGQGALYYIHVHSTQFDGQVFDYASWYEFPSLDSTGWEFYAKPGTTSTVTIYEDINDDRQDPPPQSELVAEKSIVCTSPTTGDFFNNIGECYQFAKEHPQSALTKKECRESFTGKGKNIDRA